MTKLKLSFSRISDFDRNGASALQEKKDNQSIALHKGSLVNDLLFKNVNFEDKYSMKLYERPTATLLKLSNIIIENFIKIPTKDEIETLIRNNDFWSKVKDENLYKNYDKPVFWEYLDQQMNHTGKIPITPSMKIEADEIVYLLRNHEHSKHLFHNPDIVIHSEISFEVPYRKVILRGFVDMVEVNHKDKTIRIIDLKTGGDDALSFESSFVKWRYYLQEAVYMIAIDYMKELLNVKDYKTLPFQFLYIGLKEKLPVIFDVTDKWHESALYGFETKSGYQYKGLEELLDEIEYHWYNKVFDVPYSIHKLQGQICLKDNFIRSNAERSTK